MPRRPRDETRGAGTRARRRPRARARARCVRAASTSGCQPGDVGDLDDLRDRRRGCRRRHDADRREGRRHRGARRLARQRRSCPSGTRRPHARTGGLRGSPTRPAIARAACRPPRTPWRPTCGSSSVVGLRRCRARRAPRRAARAARRDGPGEAHREQHEVGLQRRTRCPAPRPCASSPCRPSATRRARRRASRPCRRVPSKRLVATAQSRSQPSSCEDDVRSLIGQYGHTSGLFSASGGCGSSSNCVTDAAPWRFDVPTQSEPVSPPPMTTTCLPVAMIWSAHRVAGDDLVLLRQELHREVHARELAARAPADRAAARRRRRARPRRTRRAACATSTSTPDVRRRAGTPRPRRPSAPCAGRCSASPS